MTQFRGSLPSQDPYNIDLLHGLYAQNVQFTLGTGETVQVGTRRGMGLIQEFFGTFADSSILSMASWYFSTAGVPDDWILMYFQSLGVVALQQLSGALNNLIPVPGASGTSFAFEGSRMYVAFTNSTSRGAFAPGQVLSPGFPADPLFPTGVPVGDAPMVLTASTTLTGNITSGFHRIVLFMTTQNGYFGSFYALLPNAQGNPPTKFQPGLAAVITPNNSLQVTVNVVGTLPPWAAFATIQVAMTTTINPNRYFLVPGASAVLGLGTAFTIEISDNDLVEGTEVTQFQNNFGSGINPGDNSFSPSALFQYSSRMGYIAVDSSGFPVVYFSDKNKYLQLSPAFNGIYLEGKKIPIQGCSLGSVCYIATLTDLYSCQDNGDLPATWTSPARVDGSIGILAHTCLLAAGGRILLASEKGFFIFRGGAFPQVPISYWQSSDWNRINWLAPLQVQIVDDPYARILQVLAPLRVFVTDASNTNPIQITTGVRIDQALNDQPHLFPDQLTVTLDGVLGNTNANGNWNITVTGPNTFTIPVAGNGSYTEGGVATPSTPNAIMSWSYPEGDDGELFYSLRGFSSFQPGAIALVHNISNDIDETWIAPNFDNPGALVRMTIPIDPLPFRDLDMNGNPTPISSFWETSLVPGGSDEIVTIHDFHGMHIRTRGAGALNLKVFSLDHKTQIIPLASPMTLRDKPGLEIMLKWFLRNEQQSVQFGTNGIDSYFVASLLRLYYTNSLPQR